MQRDSFTKALIATAKVACCAGLLNVGCRPKTSVEAPTPAQNTNSTPEETSIPRETNTVDNGSLGSRISDEAFKKCAPIISAAFGDGAFPDMNTISDEVKDCCALTAEYYDNLAMANGVFDYGLIDRWIERDQCCAANEWSDGSRACTPWGPPTPPSAQKMKRRIIVRNAAQFA